MTPRDPANLYLGQLKKFLKFLSNLWGILGGISVFFPLSNSLLKGGLPLEMWDEGGLAFLPPELITMITTLVAVFTIFWTYGQRDRLKRNKNHVRRVACFSFVFGLISLTLFIVVYTLMKNDFHYSVMGWTSDDFRRLFFDLILLVLYAGFFGLMTRAFMLLASVEYFKREVNA